ncbi:MAG: DUF945 family protein [Francisellaceae bacterium]|jgi:hypothetical protein|nr:DUF945 family protein [Francisellaceae bacterium]MBT6539543.1 DUF945 family protein [Francisellaceae bacterium]
MITRRNLVISSGLLLFLSLNIFLVIPLFFANRVQNNFPSVTKALPGNAIINITNYDKGLYSSTAKITASIFNSSDPVSFYGDIEIKHNVLNALTLFSPFSNTSEKVIFSTKATLTPISTSDTQITSSPQIENIILTTSVHANNKVFTKISLPKMNVLHKNIQLESLPTEILITSSLKKTDAIEIKAQLPKIIVRGPGVDGHANLVNIAITKNNAGNLEIITSIKNADFKGILPVSTKNLNAKIYASNTNENDIWETINHLKFSELKIDKKTYKDSELSIALDNIPNRLDLLRLYVLFESNQLDASESPSFKFHVPINMAMDITNFFISKHFLTSRNINKLHKNTVISKELQDNHGTLAANYLFGLMNSRLCNNQGQFINCAITIKNEGIEVDGQLLNRSDPILSNFNLGKLIQKQMPSFYSAINQRSTTKN